MSTSSRAEEAGTPGSAEKPRLTGLSAKWILWCVALVIGVGAGAGIALLNHTGGVSDATPKATPSPPVATWAAGAHRAPNFTLTDQSGKEFSLSELRGRPVIVTFLDPLCRNLCPLEARVLSNAVRRLSAAARPAVVSVSVNPWADTSGNFREDAIHWNLSRNWRWGIGSSAVLAQVWKQYEIGVQVTKKVIVGVSVREISHTEAAYLIDPAGNERALLLYPFQAADVLSALAKISSQ